MLPADITRHAHITPPVCGITRWFFCAARPNFALPGWAEIVADLNHTAIHTHICALFLCSIKNLKIAAPQQRLFYVSTVVVESHKVYAYTLLLAAFNFCSLVRFKETLTARWTRLIWKGLHKYFVLETDNLNILTRIHRSSKQLRW